MLFQKRKCFFEVFYSHVMSFRFSLYQINIYWGILYLASYERMKEEFMHQMKLKLGYISCAIISVQDRETFRPPLPTRVEPYANKHGESVGLLPFSTILHFLASISGCRLLSQNPELYFSQIRKKEAWRRRKIQNNKIHF